MSKRAMIRTEGPRSRLLLWAALAGLIFGLLGAGDILEGTLRTLRNSLHWHKASGDIVLVKIDDQSLRDVGRWPWPRRDLARLLDQLTRAGAKRTFFDLTFYDPTTPADDRIFSQSLQRSGSAVLAIATRHGPNGDLVDSAPLPIFAEHASVRNISVKYNYQNAAWRVPFALSVGNKTMPSFAAELAGVSGESGDTFIPDYSIDPSSIPAISASALLRDKFDRSAIKGKDVVVGWTTELSWRSILRSWHWKVGRGLRPHHRCRNSKEGRPHYLGWIPIIPPRTRTFGGGDPRAKAREASPFARQRNGGLSIRTGRN